MLGRISGPCRNRACLCAPAKAPHLHAQRAGYAKSSKPPEGFEALGALFPSPQSDPAPALPLKDLQLHAQVQRLFVSTLQSQSGSPSHPDDAAQRLEAEAAESRLLARLQEVKERNPDSFDKLVDLLTAEQREAEAKEEEKFVEGSVPGTRNPPWAGSSVWKAFFDDLKKEMREEKENTMTEEQMDDEIRRLENVGDMDVIDPVAVRAGNTSEAELLKNQLEDSFKIDELAQAKIKKCKGTCLFCSEERDQYPLEPMNVHLLTRYMTSAGFIKSRRQTGLCKKMQGRVSKTIKHARALGLFSYKGGSFQIKNPVLCPEE